MGSFKVPWSGHLGIENFNKTHRVENVKLMCYPKKSQAQTQRAVYK